MNENATKLVAALRGGEFEQGHNRLRVGNTFCCLGVACELYRREHGGEWGETEGLESFQGATHTLPDEVQGWLGFAISDGGYSDDGSLASDNDAGWTFADIADKIERNPEGLFA